MKLEINVPDSLSEITLGQYQKFLRIDHSDEQFVAQKMLEIFCGIKLTDAMRMPLKDVRAIINMINDLLDQKPKLVRKFTLHDRQYGFIPQLDQISFGEYIDLDTYIGDWENMHKAMAVLYRPIKNSYGERYNIIDYEIMDAEVYRSIPMDAVISSILFFWNLGNELVQSMLTSLEQGEESRIVQYLNSAENGAGMDRYTHLLKETLKNLNISLH